MRDEKTTKKHTQVTESELLATLSDILSPAGGGVYVVSTGLSEQRALQRLIYGVETDDEVMPAWRAALANASEASIWLLGVPSDSGAGFTRGSNLAPSAIRAHLLARHPDHPLLSEACLDVGDVRVIPHLLSEEMLSDVQRAQSQHALYGSLKAHPVAPLELCELTLSHLSALSAEGGGVPIVLGGDHSVGWPAFKSAFQRWEVERGQKIGLLHFDAHTDLLSERLGVKYCFATWAYHANELLHRDGRLVQVGLRVSGKTRAHWESTLGVRQYWVDEVRTKGAEVVAQEVIQRFEARGVEVLYVSNDIDGTDPVFASSTGTPEPGGLSPDEVDLITQRLGERFPLIGADLVEVAPPLSRAEGEPERTLETCARYLATLAALIKVPGTF